MGSAILVPMLVSFLLVDSIGFVSVGSISGGGGSDVRDSDGIRESRVWGGGGSDERDSDGTRESRLWGGGGMSVLDRSRSEVSESVQKEGG